MKSKMALKKLPLDIQSNIHASFHIRCFKRAVEELIYNALDANSSSIAIRVHIQENYIQVIDNGHGVASHDLCILGQRHATSKFENSSNKFGQKYGCYGQSLADIIAVSQSVKITSKCMKNTETVTKSFFKGKEGQCSVTTDRPSVGTTIEIKGFLFNLTIQKKAVKAFQELQNIKIFLEQISLVHCNISISLRDNAENEIIFKVHKNRDLIKTLASVLNIEAGKLQELSVEKNQYKVTGFVTNNCEESKGYQWMYVNQRFIGNSNLHKVVNENLAKGLHLKNIMKVKSHDPNLHKDNIATSNKIPDYFLFIECPLGDYDIIPNPKQSLLEFKNLPQIKKLLEKMMKFYTGDHNDLKLVKTSKTNDPAIDMENSKDHEIDTRNKVKQIIRKILGTQQRKINGSNLHKGTKGKIIKRKPRNKVQSFKGKLKLKRENAKIQEAKYDLKNKNEFHNQTASHNAAVACPVSNTGPINAEQRKSLINEKNAHVTKPKKENINMKTNPLLLHFQKETDDLQERCNILAKRVDDLLGVKKKRKCRVFTNETVHYSKIVKDNQSISIRKKINQIVIHEYLPVAQKPKNMNHIGNNFSKVKTSKDLIHPVIHVDDDVENKAYKLLMKVKRPKIAEPQLDPVHEPKTLGPTYESHGYLKETQLSQPKNAAVEIYKKAPTLFISKTSLNNFVSHQTQGNLKMDSKAMGFNDQKTHRNLNHKKTNALSGVTESYPIDFTKTYPRISAAPDISQNAFSIISCSDTHNIGGTYTLAESVKDWDNADAGNTLTRTSCFFDTSGNEKALDSSRALNLNLSKEEFLCFPKSQHIEKTDIISDNRTDTNDNNVVFVSNSQSSNHSKEMDPIEICETIIGCNDDNDIQDCEEYNYLFESINDFTTENTHWTDMKTRPGRTENSNCLKEKDDDCLCVNSKQKQNDCGLEDERLESYNFNLKNRRRYIPKGMSPIFENCYLKHVCNYELDDDYFDEAMYENFVQNVQIYSDILEPNIQNVKDTAPKDVQRFDDKLNKDNACFIFNGESLKQAKVLGQVDNKFIGTVIKEDYNGTRDYLVLFDQHAVHERIRLEQNLLEYIVNAQWKSVSLDGVSLKLTRDEILYLHNHKDKFQRLGLQWCIENDTQVLINGIPEAILGKNSRQVDVVLKAVKNLIKEEIIIIKEQGGCVSTYPKSIMDLVFSEACRYAVMFGDSLSVHECSSLIDALSRCKTPFQCAHGRPSMAVLVNVARETRAYTVLGQVDNKFIGTVIKEDYNGTRDYLVLFDQHAVHERIRLEQNLLEYIVNAQWKSVSLDGVSLKLTRDEILYLHNHKDKFQRLGLQWCIENDTQVLINGIPEAILGKNSRQVDVVLKAVKNLIKEEIIIIKEQGGCVSTYPKSIMDLVFSEACRYAVMFGDSLSVHECSSLIDALSRCKTPFQCAHGRPSMAVLVNVARETRAYTVNYKKVELFRRKLNMSKLNKCK